MTSAMHGWGVVVAALGLLTAVRCKPGTEPPLGSSLPAAPSALTATPTPASGTAIDLTWQDNATNEDGFRIERSDAGGPFGEIATVGPNATGYHSAGLTERTTYSYRVRAHNAAGPSPQSNVATAATVPAPVDRPDEVATPHIHVVYALPSDGLDRRLDVNGTLAATVGSFQTWLATQTGGKALRVDTDGGALDVTFVRLSRSDGTIRSYGAYVRDTLERELVSRGLNDAGKIYVVYYDGGSTYACGGGAWPPALPGRVAALYLQGTPPGASPCNTNSLASSPTAAPGYLEFAMLHEILHTMGFVASSAPHHTLAGHVSEDPRDLMYAGSEPWRPSILDVGQDDYYGANVPAGVLNLRDSSFLR